MMHLGSFLEGKNLSLFAGSVILLSNLLGKLHLKFNQVVLNLSYLIHSPLTDLLEQFL